MIRFRFYNAKQTNLLAFNFQTLIIHVSLANHLQQTKIIGWRRQVNRHAFLDCVRRFLHLRGGDQLVLVLGAEPLSLGEIAIRRISVRHVTAEQDADCGRITRRVCDSVQSTVSISLSGDQLLEQRTALWTLPLYSVFIRCSGGLHQLQGNGTRFYSLKIGLEHRNMRTVLA